MTIPELLIQPSLVGALFLIMASAAFWNKKPKLAPVDGMQLLNSTHTLVETGNHQVNNRLGRLENRMDGIETKLDTLITLNIRS